MLSELLGGGRAVTSPLNLIYCERTCHLHEQGKDSGLAKPEQPA